MGLHRRSTDISNGPDTCEFPGCGIIGDNFHFVSYAINPKNGNKGMLLCPNHEARATRGQRNG